MAIEGLKSLYEKLKTKGITIERFWDCYAIKKSEKVKRGRMPWDTTDLPYKNQQQGMGKYILCKTCNNNTGSWYGEDYRIVVRVVHSMLSEPMDPQYQAFGIRDIHPLRFIKQVLSMFCSINNFEDDIQIEFIRGSKRIEIE